MSDPLSAPPPLTAAPTVTAAPPTTVVAPPPTTITATPAPIIAESPGANISPLLRLYEQSISAQVSVLATRWSGNDLLIKFSASTSVQPPYPASSFSNERSHRDLERLVAHLLKMYPTNIVPAALLIPGPPSARALDRGFAAALEKVLTRLFAHPIFSADAAMILFFTSPAVVPYFTFINYTPRGLHDQYK
ncbi:hypothetical protein BC828DRAFT_243120 [Blastocladiella britannica]|nr:hypothetical protein BC828DRAFT_243120 [Blastocladiella britannica]